MLRGVNKEKKCSYWIALCGLEEGGGKRDFWPRY